jgi:hypothetical protein
MEDRDDHGYRLALPIPGHLEGEISEVAERRERDEISGRARLRPGPRPPEFLKKSGPLTEGGRGRLSLDPLSS